MRVTVLHHVNGATKTATLSGPHVSTQMVDGGIHVVLAGTASGPDIGYAMFTNAGLVALSGAAVEQYGPLSAPTQNEEFTEEKSA